VPTFRFPANEISPEAAAGEESPPPLRGHDRYRRLRWLTVLLGLLGTMTAVAVPILPVVNDVVTLPPRRHPGGQRATGVASAVVVARGRAVYRDAGAQRAFVRVGGAGRHNAARADLRQDDRDVAAGTARRAGRDQPRSAGDDRVVAARRLHGVPERGPEPHHGNPRRQALVDLRDDTLPQVTGIFSDLDGARDTIKGLSVDLRIDARFQTSPTVLKTVVMVLAEAALAARVVIVRRLDLAPGGGRRCWLRGVVRPTGRDVTGLCRTESFWSRMQVELLDRHRWRTRIELANAIFEYLEIFHNRQRRHSSLGMLTPIQFENTTVVA